MITAILFSVSLSAVVPLQSAVAVLPAYYAYLCRAFYCRIICALCVFSVYVCAVSVCCVFWPETV